MTGTRLAAARRLMLFFRKARNLRSVHAIAIVRDVVEVIAIVAAGIWAFYVFPYENRIKPSMADPDVNVTASIQRLGERNGLIAVGLHFRLQNIGSVTARFLGVAVNVYGQRIVASEPHVTPQRHTIKYEFDGFYRMGPLVPVYTWAYVTHLGDPSSLQETGLDPGTTIDNYRIFYVPQNRFDLLTVGIEAPYTKFDTPVSTRLIVKPGGDVRARPVDLSRINQYNITPVTSLDIR
jgi:hypothetical protein